MRKLIATLIVVLAAGLAATVHAGTSGASALPINCGAKEDDSGHWEVVYGTERTRASAHRLLVRVRAKHFLAWIEVDSCTAFEVARGGFKTRAAAQVAVREAIKAGFTKTKDEHS
jgi:hypothetical protein